MKDLSFIAIEQIKDSPLWQAELARINYSLAIAYYAEYYQAAFKDHSFLVTINDELIGYCICLQVEGKLCFPAEGVKIVWLDTYVEKYKKIYGLILTHLEKIALENVCKEIIIKNEFVEGKLCGMGEAMFNSNYVSQLTFEMLIDLKDFDEKTYFTNIRKRYKSFINWGRKELEISLINKDSLSYEKFTEFKKFHLKIAGRQTRSDATWDIQYKMLEQGVGEVVLANYQGNLVAACMFIDQFDATAYITGVYERELFEFGISHYIMFHSICRTHARGRTKIVTLGNFDTDIADPKWYNIQHFKKGFCNNFAPTVLWKKKIGGIND